MSDPLKISAGALVRFEIEVPLSGSFGNAWTVEQLHRDAERTMDGVISQIMNKLPHVRLASGSRPTLIATVIEAKE